MARLPAGSGADAELRLDLRGCGRFLLYASRRPAAVHLAGQPAHCLKWDSQRGALWFDVPWQQAHEGGPLQAVVSFKEQSGRCHCGGAGGGIPVSPTPAEPPDGQY